MTPSEMETFFMRCKKSIWKILCYRFNAPKDLKLQRLKGKSSFHYWISILAETQLEGKGAK